jgi:hypothetical protein
MSYAGRSPSTRELAEPAGALYLLGMHLVGDADRERSIARLRRHYAEGRLSVEELDDRASVLTGARTTRELRVALRDLPNGLLESELVPRLVALRSSSVGEAVAGRLARLALAVTLLLVWLWASLVLLVALAVWQLAAGASLGAAAAFTLAWAAVTWLSWRIWRRGSPTRHAHSPGSRR